MKDDPRVPSAAAAFPLRGAVLLTDLVGFTPLAEQATRGGRHGVEALQAVLGDYFSRLVSCVHAHGGEVVSFAGDASVALWREEGDLEAAARAAAGCSLELGGCLMGPSLPKGARLEQRVVLGVGPLWEIQVGGVEGRWESLVAGPVLDQVARLSHAGGPGVVVLSPEARGCLGPRAKTEPLPEGAARLVGLGGPAAGRKAVAQTLPEEAEGALRAFVPRALLALLDAGHTAWLAELRRVTVMFAGLGRPDGSAAALERLQTLVTAAQTAVYRHGGTVHQVSADEKGVTLFAAWGLSMQSHDDNAVRAVRAALELHDTVAALGDRVSVGVSTGNGFSGLRGAGPRREYALVGDVVNTAARLMSAAQGGILCEAVTQREAQARVGFAPRAPQSVKGKAEPLAVWVPTRLREHVSSPRTELVGREAEVEALVARLVALEAGRPGDVVVLEGEPGIGKSRLVQLLRERAAASPVRSLVLVGDPIERNTSWGAARAVVEEVLALGAAGSPEARRAHAEALLDALPDGRARGAFLAGLLPVSPVLIGPFVHTSADARALAANTLLLELLAAALEGQRVLLFAEDLHWFDDASLAVLTGLRSRLPTALLVATTRPLVATGRSHALSVLLEGATRLRLGPLDAAATLRLACARLGVDALPDDVARLVEARCEGHPFFTEEIVRGLRDAGALRVVAGQCTLVPGALESVPYTVQGVVSGRIDALPPRHRLVLKVASVLGRSFGLEALRAVHPIADDHDALPALLGEAADLDLVLPESDGWSFRHRIIHDVAYELLPSAQRRQLHRVAALWCEAHLEGDAERMEPRLAHHWDHAGDAPKALHYLERAGAHTLRDGRYLAARAFLERALNLVLDHDDPATLLRRATLERRLGQAVGGAGDLLASRAPLERAAAVLGYAVPTSRVELAAGIAGALGQQVLHRWWGSRRAAGRREDSTREAAHAIYLLSPVAYMAGDTPLTVYCGLRSLNLAEQCPPSGILARGYSVLHYLTGVVGMTGASDRYYARAVDAATVADDPRAIGEILYNASVFHHGAAQNDRAWALLEEAQALHTRHGERRAGRLSLAMQASVAMRMGRVPASRAMRARLRALSLEDDDIVGHFNGLVWLGYFEVHSQRIAEGVARLAEALRLARQSDNRIGQLLGRGLLAEGHLLAGDFAAARAVAEEALRHTAHAQSFATLEGEAALVTVWHALWRRGEAGAEAQARRARAGLAQSARVFPLGRSAARRSAATALWLTGRQRAARAGWLDAAALAARQKLPLEVALAHLEMGLALPGEEGQRHREIAAKAYVAAEFVEEATRIRQIGERPVTR
jgi:class 3 adenylate cyclase